MIYNIKRQKEDERDKTLKVALGPELVAQELPKGADLRDKCPVVFNQGELGSCHDGLTEVLTVDGWKLFKDITYTDKLATVNPDTNEMVYENPTNIISYEYDGDMYYSKNKSLDFALTDNHKMLVRKWNEKERKLNQNYELVEIKDIGWYIGLMSDITYNGTNNSNVYVLPEIEHKQVALRAEKEIDMKLWLQLLGIYLAEGTLIKNDDNHYKIQLACYKDREKNFIKDLLNNLNLNYTELDDRITFENKQIYQEFVNYGLLGVKSYDKFVPKFVFEQSADNIKEFILGYFMGDGSLNKNNRMFYTTSKLMAEQLQLLIFLSGKISSISVRPPRTSTMKNGRIIVGKHDENCVIERFRNKLSIERKNQLEIKHYKGTVYCAEVSSYHTLVTRRNGKILISGNCSANAGCANIMMLLNKTNIMLSRLYMYYKEREMEGTINEDSGAMMRDICKVACMGVCEEKFMPYVIERFTQAPSLFATQNAAYYKVKSYHACRTLNDIKRALAINSAPVLMGMEIFSSFEGEEIAGNGIMKMPEANEENMGGHAVLIVGYDDDKEVFIVRNSWGEEWGDKGYFYMPYEFVKQGLAFDFWVLQ